MFFLALVVRLSDSSSSKGRQGDHVKEKEIYLMKSDSSLLMEENGGGGGEGHFVFFPPLVFQQ